MKQKHFLFTALAVFFALEISIFTACDLNSDSTSDEIPVTPAPETVTVTFDSNAPIIQGETATVTGKMEVQTVKKDVGFGKVYLTLSPCPFIIPDTSYKFGGWATTADATTVEFTDEERIYLVKHTTLYAVWRDKSDNPLKANDIVVNDADSFVFDVSKTDFIFTGNLFNEDFKKILDATKDLKTSVSLDFSGCIGIPFTLKDGSSYSPIVNKTANIKSLVLPPNLSEMPTFFLSGNYKVRNIEINGKTETIGQNAVISCSALETIKLGEGIKIIRSCAFSNNTKITSIDIPLSVETLSKDAFICLYNSALTAINVTNDNKNYCSIDGVLFNKDKTKLLVYPQGKGKDAYFKYLVPSSVTEISDNAFSNAKRLGIVEIPSSVTEIGLKAFESCSSLKIVTFDEGLKTIGDGAFYSTPISTITLPNTLETLGDDKDRI